MLSVFPVVGIAMQVHDRHDDNLPGARPKEDAERKGPHQASADIKRNDRVQAGIDGDAVGGVLDSREEPSAQIGLLCFIERGGRDHFGFRLGMKSDPLHVNEA